MIPGQETDAPALVRCTREPAPAKGSAAVAARAHLDGRRSRYRIADPERDPVPAGTTAADGREAVRLQQRHRGVPVLGGQYVVRTEREGGERVVTGTSGKYFTGLGTGTTPEVGEELAVEVNRRRSSTSCRVGRTRRSGHPQGPGLLQPRRAVVGGRGRGRPGGMAGLDHRHPRCGDPHSAGGPLRLTATAHRCG